MIVTGVYVGRDSAPATSSAVPGGSRVCFCLPRSEKRQPTVLTAWRRWVWVAEALPPATCPMLLALWMRTGDVAKQSRRFGEQPQHDQRKGTHVSDDLELHPTA